MNSIDKHLDIIFDLYRQEGFSNRIEIVYQITCLLYLKSLEDIEFLRKCDSQNEKSVFTGCEDYKWSSLLSRDFYDLYLFYENKIFPFLCLQPLGLGLDSVNKSIQIRPADYIFHQLLVEIDAIFKDTLKGESINSKTIFLYGKIYETLLSGIKRDLQKTRMLYAPKHLRRLICELAQVKSDDTVYDPAMGVGNLLVDAHERMLLTSLYADKCFDDQDGFSAISNKLLDVNYEKWTEGIVLEGDEVDMNLLLFAEMNFYFHFVNLQQPQFKRGMIAGVMRHHTFEKILSVIPSNKHSLDIVGQSLEKLDANGIAVFVVPMHFLYNTNKRYSDIRRKLLDRYKVEAVISLPENEFAPQAAINTAMLIIRNEDPSIHQNIWFCDLKNDGYSNDIKRVKNADKPLTDLIKAFWQKEELHNEWFDSSLIPLGDVIGNDASLLVPLYVDVSDEANEEIDLNAIVERLDYFQDKVSQGIKELKKYLQ